MWLCANAFPCLTMQASIYDIPFDFRQILREEQHETTMCFSHVFLSCVRAAVNIPCFHLPAVLTLSSPFKFRASVFSKRLCKAMREQAAQHVSRCKAKLTNFRLCLLQATSSSARAPTRVPVGSPDRPSARQSDQSPAHKLRKRHERCQTQW